MSTFRRIREALGLAEIEAIAGLREIGMSDAKIGRELNITRQAVRQRWPRRAGG